MTSGITGNLKSRIDKLWEEFWTGGITNPLTVIEQISFLMFARMLDIREGLSEKKAARLGKGKVKMLFSEDQQHLRWSRLKNLPGEKMLGLVRDAVFPHFKTLGNSGSTFSEYMADAQLLIQKPSLLVSAVNMIDALPLEQADTKGDLYEYLLSKLTTAGINGQFRTPRHIIRLMVDLVAPKPTDTIADPACGTGGFLVTALEYLYRENTSPAGRITRDDDGIIYSGDLLEPYREHIQKDMFYGFDFDATMLRIACMNLILHGLENPQIHYMDTLSNAMPEKFPGLASNRFDVILANPPFKGSLDYSDVHPSLTGKVKTKKTELLFVVLMLRMLKMGGRCAVIVPDGVLFGTSQAHSALRKMLVEENQLEAVISLPGGVFKPYAGVSTGILLFTKGGKTENVWFYDVEADGLSLDDKRGLVDENDLPDVRVQWAKWNGGRGFGHFEDRTAKAFFIPAALIRQSEYDLSVNRYGEHVHQEVRYDPPKVILSRLAAMEQEIADNLQQFGGMLR